MRARGRGLVESVFHSYVPRSHVTCSKVATWKVGCHTRLLLCHFATFHFPATIFIKVTPNITNQSPSPGTGEGRGEGPERERAGVRVRNGKGSGCGLLPHHLTIVTRRVTPITRRRYSPSGRSRMSMNFAAAGSIHSAS